MASLQAVLPQKGRVHNPCWCVCRIRGSPRNPWFSFDKIGNCDWIFHKTDRFTQQDSFLASSSESELTTWLSTQPKQANKFCTEHVTHTWDGATLGGPAVQIWAWSDKICVHLKSPSLSRMCLGDLANFPCKTHAINRIRGDLANV